MTDKRKVLAEGERQTNETAYYLAVVDRLEAVLGPWLDERECVALVHVLIYHTFVCDDGFVINGDDSLTSLGVWGAADIAACFSKDPQLDVPSLKIAYRNGISGQYELAEELKQRILSDPSIRLVEQPRADE
jgi:hypothetical protein